MAGINLNVFKGFSQEYELVDFFLTKQYHENVSAVAGMFYFRSNKYNNKNCLNDHFF